MTVGDCMKISLVEVEAVNNVRKQNLVIAFNLYPFIDQGQMDSLHSILP